VKVTRLYIRNLIKEVIAESDDKVHIGYGKYKDKGKEKDPNAQVYKKTDQGKFEPVGGDDGKGAEKEPDKPKITKIDANPFDPEKPADEPSPDKTGELDKGYEPKRGQEAYDNARKELADISVDLETHEGDIPKSVANSVDRFEQDIMARRGAYKNADGVYETDDGKPFSDKTVEQILSDATGRTPNEMGFLRDKVKQVIDPDKPEKDSEWDDTSMGQRNRSYGGRGFGEEPDPTEIDSALQDAEEGMYDALNRGMSYGEDRDVDRMIDDDIQAALDAGATDEDLMDFADNLDGEGRQMFQDALNNLAYDLDVIQSDFYNAPMGGRTGSTVNQSPSDPNYKSPGERDTKGSDNPYDWEEPDDDDDNFYDEVGGADLDQTIDNAIDGIIPERREKAFELIVQGFDDDYDVKEMYSNLENNQIPKPDQDPFGAIQHAILMQGINDGTLDFGDTGMKLANYIETREEDLYDTIMGEGVYNLRKEFIEYNKYNERLMKSFI